MIKTQEQLTLQDTERKQMNKAEPWMLHQGTGKEQMNRK